MAYEDLINLEVNNHNLNQNNRQTIQSVLHQTILLDTFQARAYQLMKNRTSVKNHRLTSLSRYQKTA